MFFQHISRTPTAKYKKKKKKKSFTYLPTLFFWNRYRKQTLFFRPYVVVGLFSVSYPETIPLNSHADNHYFEMYPIL